MNKSGYLLQLSSRITIHAITKNRNPSFRPKFGTQSGNILLPQVIYKKYPQINIRET